ncbi:MAG: ComF family protein [Candidatus Portnoybacteria bacterium]|nr:ComF family protein [Candidatus Portnoybacteria bacterium]
MKFLDLLFPPYCVACRSDLGEYDQFDAVCDTCFLRVREAGHQFKKLSPIDRVVFYAPYQDPVIRILIHHFKYRGVKGLAAPLAELGCRALEEAGVSRLWSKQKPVITFIPLHPLRERLRGYNQSALLAHEAGEHFSLPVLPLARRVALTPAQAVIDNPKDRRANIKNAFELLVSRAPQKIILVDDVFTSGSTLKEAGRMLRKGGAKTIWAITAAGKS